MIRPPAHTALTMALAAMVLLAASCARHVSRTPGAPAGILWQSFQEARQRATLTGPGLSARASLQYDGPGRKSRVVLKLWGDLGYPLRLDMEAGIGASIAMLREDAQGWTAYFPQSGEAMVNADPRRGLWALGVDAPLSLADLAGLATGAYDGLAPHDFVTAEASGDGGWTYALRGPGPVSRLTLDAMARPVSMTGSWAGRPWELTLSGHDDADGPGAAARKMTLARPPDTTVVIRIKELERRRTPWPPEAMTLELPPHTRIIPPADGPVGTLP